MSTRSSCVRPTMFCCGRSRSIERWKTSSRFRTRSHVPWPASFDSHSAGRSVAIGRTPRRPNSISVPGRWSIAGGTTTHSAPPRCSSRSLRVIPNLRPRTPERQTRMLPCRGKSSLKPGFQGFCSTRRFGGCGRRPSGRWSSIRNLPKPTPRWARRTLVSTIGSTRGSRSSGPSDSIRPYPHPHDLRGVGTFPLAQTAEALRLLEAALDVDPLSLHVRRTLAFTQIVAGRYDEAIVHLRRVLNVDPDYPHASLRVGESIDLLGQARRSAGDLEHTSAPRVGQRIPT